tara:strand:- start:2432 stop:2848 length:417 start_codon:yes stop_codon:yes gene_type:complete
MSGVVKVKKKERPTDVEAINKNLLQQDKSKNPGGSTRDYSRLDPDMQNAIERQEMFKIVENDLKAQFNDGKISEEQYKLMLEQKRKEMQAKMDRSFGGDGGYQDGMPVKGYTQTNPAHNEKQAIKNIANKVSSKAPKK